MAKLMKVKNGVVRTGHLSKVDGHSVTTITERVYDENSELVEMNIYQSSIGKYTRKPLALTASYEF